MSDSLRAVVRRLRQASAAASPGLTDALLLDRFVRDRDEAAFEVLVWRHGPAVLGVCRRTLGNSADADDAFQAVFLTLVKKAGAVRRGDVIAAWLCRVAFRIAIRLRSERRRRTYAALAEVEAPTLPVADSGLRSALDAEIDRLPEPFRRVVVLCYLHGQTTTEAARALGCPRGTVLSRLAAARKRLRRRLTQRGLAPAGLFATAVAAVWPSGDLVAATVTVVKTFAAGEAIPRELAALSQGVIRAMFLNKVKITIAVVLSVGVIGLGAGWLTHSPTAVADSKPVAKAADKPTDSQRPAPKKSAPKAEPEPEFKVIEVKDPDADAVAREMKVKFLQEASANYRQQLRDLDRALVQHATSVRLSAVEIEERIKLMERLRERHRKAEAEGSGLGGDLQTREKEIAEREEKHMQQIVSMRQRLIKVDAERAREERELAEKREEIMSKMRVIAEKVHELEDTPAKSAVDLEKRIATLERELAELRRELRRRGKD